MALCQIQNYVCISPNKSQTLATQPYNFLPNTILYQIIITPKNVIRILLSIQYQLPELKFIDNVRSVESYACTKNRYEYRVGKKIMCEITLLLFRPSFIDLILKPQNPFTISTLYQIYNKVINSSYMKLDNASMQKLFLLILMTFKKQIFMLSSPLQIYTLTLTHLNDVLTIQNDKPQSTQCLKSVIDKFKQTTDKWTYMQYFQIKQQILSTLQNYKSKIILFCQIGIQDKQGNFIFFPRNAHNRQQITLPTTPQNTQKQLQIAKLWNDTQNLQYINYQSWKTKLGKNQYDNARSSNKLKSKIQDQIQFNQKQLSDILGLKNQNLDHFQLNLDLFTNQSSQKQLINNNNKQKSSKIGKPQGKNVKQTKIVNDIKKKIDKQFDDLL